MWSKLPGYGRAVERTGHPCVVWARRDMEHAAPPSTMRPQHRIFEQKRQSSQSSSGSPSPADHVLERGIQIGPWTVRVLHGSIANTSEVDALSHMLDLPPPEMVFPRNALTLEHAPSGFVYCFDATRALQCVDGVNPAHQLEPIDCAYECALAHGGYTLARDVGERRRRLSRSGIKVAHAHAWGKSHQVDKMRESTVLGTAAIGGIISTAKQYDWTYSSTWPGMNGSAAPVDVQVSAPAESVDPRIPFELATDPARDRIPTERLGPSSGEPILFYDDIVLYEDELGDNGSSMLSVKVVRTIVSLSDAACDAKLPSRITTVLLAR